VTGNERVASALIVSCGFCWAAPGTPCGDDGMHLARYVRAYRRGLVSRDELAVICEVLPQISAGHVVSEAVVVPDLQVPGG
jgi:hypothetical protein